MYFQNGKLKHNCLTLFYCINYMFYFLGDKLSHTLRWRLCDSQRQQSRCSAAVATRVLHLMLHYLIGQSMTLMFSEYCATVHHVTVTVNMESSCQQILFSKELIQGDWN